MLNDTYDMLSNEKVTVVIQYDDTEQELLTWDCPGADGFNNVKGPSVQTKIPPMKNNLFTIQVRVAGKPQYNSTYRLVFSGKSNK